MTAKYTSTNLQKHTNKNPLQRRLIDRFHLAATGLVQQLQGRQFLDVGCGEGFAMQAVLSPLAGAQIVGVDLVYFAAAIARQSNPGAHFTVANALRLPFADKSFDVVVCMEVLEHLDHPDSGLAELKRVARQHLLLSVPNEPLFRGANFLRGKNITRLGNDVGHVQNWPARSFVRFVGRHCQVQSWRTSFPWTLVLCRVD